MTPEKLDEPGPDDACAECYRQGWVAGQADAARREAALRDLTVERLARALAEDDDFALGLGSGAYTAEAERLAALLSEVPQ